MNWLERLQSYLQIPAEIIPHENTSCYLRIEKERGKTRVFLHRLFSEAPSPVLEAIARYCVRKDRKALALIRQMAHLHFSTVRLEPIPLKEQGSVYDLREIYERIKQKYFDPSFDSAIGWSNRGRAGSFRFMTFGSYDRQHNQIRMNPLLDDCDVPLFFIEFIVYHEMLHAVCPPEIDRLGRVKVHTRQFKEKERLFERFDEAREWEKKSLRFFKKRKRLHGRA